MNDNEATAWSEQDRGGEIVEGRRGGGKEYTAAFWPLARRKRDIA